MLTATGIRAKMNAFPEDKPVKELLDELVLLYKIEKSLKEVADGKGISLNDFDKELEIIMKER